MRPRAGLSDTLVRHWRMLRLIPRAPRKVDTGTLESALRAEGHAVDRRSIQRDLHKLSTVFPIVCDDAHKPYGWSWMRDGLSPHLVASARAIVVRARIRDRFVDELPIESSVTPARGGWSIAEGRASDGVELRRAILGLGDAVEILAPLGLREEIVSTLHAALDLYESGG